ncbi:type I-D CRISPR-associated protein Cas7/Csc2 [Candidatus Poribacteria bacterium]|nr:type I-D CRISPR-associated protein Cas7/Csc2 [Candidatus Poribacteria bacterium]
MNNSERFDAFVNQLCDVETLVPRDVKKKKIAKAIYTRNIATIVGIKTTTGRFLPVSHEGYSNETYVDKVYELLGRDRAEFIGRKLKGIERRAHMTLFREMIESENKTEWRQFFENNFGKECMIPDNLCIACWNCSLFGGLEPGKGATFSRIRYFDTFSVEDSATCIQTDDSPEQMAIGNTVGEDLSVERSEASFHRYEYVKAGTRFPFITIIESPTLLDVAGYLMSVKLADQHGYGKYSANHGKFTTQFLAVSTGYPMFSVLDMLKWAEADDNSQLKANLKFESALNEPVTILDDEIELIQGKLNEAFQSYMKVLNPAEGT